MPSTTLIPDSGPLDLGHLTRMTSGETGLEREVLEMFLKQTDRILKALADEPADTATLSHTLKGSARAIGAFAVGDSAAALEDAARSGADLSAPLAELRGAIGEARQAIDTRLGRT
jgi:HPt (histidine-containing phosphotransfer) domain-containing protein